LIDDIGDGLNLNEPEQKGEDSDSSEEEERFKGLTPYEIRIKIK
jgi:hypothetical protein